MAIEKPTSPITPEALLKRLEKPKFDPLENEFFTETQGMVDTAFGYKGLQRTGLSISDNIETVRALTEKEGIKDPNLLKEPLYWHNVKSHCFQIMHEATQRILSEHRESLQQADHAVKQAETKLADLKNQSEPKPTEAEIKKAQDDLRDRKHELQDVKDDIIKRINIFPKLIKVLQLIATREDTKKDKLGLGEVAYLKTRIEEIGLFLSRVPDNLMKIIDRLIQGQSLEQKHFDIMIEYLGKNLDAKAYPVKALPELVSQVAGVQLIWESMSGKDRWAFAQYALANVGKSQDALDRALGKDNAYTDLLANFQKLDELQAERKKTEDKMQARQTEAEKNYPVLAESRQLRERIDEWEGSTEAKTQFATAYQNVLDTVLAQEKSKGSLGVKNTDADNYRKTEYEQAKIAKNKAETDLEEAKKPLSAMESRISNLRSEAELHKRLQELETRPLAGIMAEEDKTYEADIIKENGERYTHPVVEAAKKFQEAFKKDPSYKNKETKKFRTDLSDKLKDWLTLRANFVEYREIAGLSLPVRQKQKVLDEVNDTFKKASQTLIEKQKAGQKEDSTATAKLLADTKVPKLLGEIMGKVAENKDYTSLQNELTSKYPGLDIAPYIAACQKIAEVDKNRQAIEKLADLYDQLDDKDLKPLIEDITDAHIRLDQARKYGNAEDIAKITEEIKKYQLDIENQAGSKKYPVLSQYLAKVSEVSAFGGPATPAELAKYRQDKKEVKKVKDKLTDTLGKDYEARYIKPLEDKKDSLESQLNTIAKNQGKDSTAYRETEQELAFTKQKISLAKDTKDKKKRGFDDQSSLPDEWGGQFMAMRDALDEQERAIGLLAIDQVSQEVGPTAKEKAELASIDSEIAKLHPEQMRAELAKFQSDPAYKARFEQHAKNIQVLDQLWQTGLLTQYQAEHLLKEAKDKGINLENRTVTLAADGSTHVERKTDLATAIQTGTYNKKVQEEAQKLINETISLQTGSARNVVHKGFDMLPGIAVGVWAAMVFALNVAGVLPGQANRSRFFGNKAAGASILAGLWSFEYLTGGHRGNANVFGKGKITGPKETVAEKKQKDQLAKEKQWAGLYSAHPRFGDYLLNHFDDIYRKVDAREISAFKIEETKLTLDDLPPAFAIENIGQPYGLDQAQTLNELSEMYTHLVKVMDLTKQQPAQEFSKKVVARESGVA